MITPTLILLVVFAGLGFCLLNIIYRLGHQKNVPVQPIALSVALIGTIYFTVCTWPAPFWQAPWQVLGAGLLVGLSQYLLLLLIASALRHGPLSPMNCALFLGFVLVILMSRLVWHETLSVLQVIGVAMAVLCVIVASFQTNDNQQEGAPPRTSRTWLLYTCILAGLFIVNAINSAAMKVLGMLPEIGQNSYAGLYGNHYLAILYLTLGVCLGLDILLKGQPQGPLRWRIGLGLVGTIGSVTGMSLMRLCASLPAAFTFPVIALTLILGGALVSVFYFGERTTRARWAMMASGAIAAGCLIVDALTKVRG